VGKLLGSLHAAVPIALVLGASSSAASSGGGSAKASVRDFDCPM
jgi:hypothetical protein